MSRLYNDYSMFYHEIYQQLFDYDEEYHLYKSYLDQHQCQSTIEIGCGSGNISKRLSEASIEYIGMDISNGMIAIAKTENPDLNFQQGDMRDFKLDKKLDSAIVTGRSMSHMVTNEDVFSALQSIHNNIKDDGLLIFDFFNASKLFASFQKESEQEVDYKGTYYSVKNKNTPNLETGWTWNWKADYKRIKDDEEVTFQDFTTMRGFTEDEIGLFLTMTGFELKELKDRGIALLAIAKKR